MSEIDEFELHNFFHAIYFFYIFVFYPNLQTHIIYLQATMQGLQGPQVWRLLLLLKGQCILYRRYGDVLEPFKYAGYPMLLNAVTVDKDDNDFLSSDRASLLIAASELIWLT